MYNLLKYSQNYSVTSGSFCNYYRDKIDKVDVNHNASDGTSLDYKRKVVGKTPERPPQPGNPGEAHRPAQLPLPSLNVEFTIPLKYLSNFWRPIYLPLTKFKATITKQVQILKIISIKLYIHVATLSVNNNIKLLENLKRGFKRTISWNKYRSESNKTTQKQQFGLCD